MNETETVEFIEHTTIDGERWDQLADRYYGNALLYRYIVRANPYVDITPLVPSCVTLRIPLLEQTAIAEDKGDLPPWRQ